MSSDSGMLNISDFTNTKVYLQVDELNFTSSSHKFWSAMHLKKLENMMGTELKQINGIFKLTNHKKPKTSGHTPSVQSVWIDNSLGPAIITGFCSIQGNFEPPEVRKALGVIPPSIRWCAKNKKAI